MRIPIEATSPQSMGGHARAAKLAPEKRSKIASNAAKIRWAGRVNSPAKPEAKTRVRIPIETSLDAASLAAIHRLAAAIEALTDRVEALTGGKVPDPPEYADPERVRAWASQFGVALSVFSTSTNSISFDDIAKVNTERLKYGRPPFVLKTTP